MSKNVCSNCGGWHGGQFGECQRSYKSSSEPACSTAEILAGEIYEQLGELEMEAGQGAMYLQDERVHKPIWVSACAEIIRKHCR